MTPAKAAFRPITPKKAATSSGRSAPAISAAARWRRIFSPENFAATAQNPQIKMIEIKLSQGAKPGHGGVLPAAKVTPEIAAIRGVPMGQDCVSPPGHSAFSTPLEMMDFIERLRDLSGGKPVGMKFCLGQPVEFLRICKAMLESGTAPDFIVVDGKEGGTGAAPLEFMDHLGMPMRDGLNFVHNALVGIGLRDQMKIGCSGKILTAFDMARAMALGADWCNSARGFMFCAGLHPVACPATRTPARPASRPRTPGAAAPFTCRTRWSASPISTAPPCIASPN